MEYIEDLEGIKEDSLKAYIEKVSKGLPQAKRILILFPDYSRTDFTAVVAPILLKRYKGSKIDFLNAGGTHRPMSEKEFSRKLNIAPGTPNTGFLNHDFSNPLKLVTIGKIPLDTVREKTEGRLNSDIDITVNKLLFSGYDLIIAISGTVPHEASGYSGGLKIFFPGVSGPDVIDLFHWAAVLVGIPRIIGTKDNSARDIINYGSKVIFGSIKCPIYSLNMVSTEESAYVNPVGLYTAKGYGGFLSAYAKATEASSKVHIKYIKEPLLQVVQVIPAQYDEVWLAGKGSYKLQRPGVLKKGAEVILYAPHIKKFHSNEVIEKDILSLGYHCRDYICSMMEEGLNISKIAASHLINVRGPGIYDKATKKEGLDFKVTLATSIPADICAKAGLSYRDPKSIKKSGFAAPGKLWIEDGGKYLYDLDKDLT